MISIISTAEYYIPVAFLAIGLLVIHFTVRYITKTMTDSWHSAPQGNRPPQPIEFAATAITIVVAVLSVVLMVIITIHDGNQAARDREAAAASEVRQLESTVDNEAVQFIRDELEADAREAVESEYKAAYQRLETVVEELSPNK